MLLSNRSKVATLHQSKSLKLEYLTNLIDLKFLFDCFTTREWATFTLIGCFILFSATKKSVRNSIINLIKTLFSKKIVIPILIAYIYLTLLLLCFMWLRLWDEWMLYDSLVYIIFTAPTLIFKYVRDNNHVANIIGIIKDSISVAIAIEFYLNLYTFPYVIELLCQLFIALFVLLGIYNKRKTHEERIVYGCTQTMYYLLIILILCYSIYMLINRWSSVISHENLLSLLFPLIATLLYWPYLYLLCVYSAYETWFVRIKFASEHNERIYRNRRKSIVRVCKINLRKINFIQKRLQLFMPDVREHFDSELNKIASQYNVK